MSGAAATATEELVRAYEEGPAVWPARTHPQYFDGKLYSTSFDMTRPVPASANTDTDTADIQCTDPRGRYTVPADATNEVKSEQALTVVRHMLKCGKRHGAFERSLFNLCLQRMRYWVTQSQRLPGFIIGATACRTLVKGDDKVLLMGEHHITLDKIDAAAACRGAGGGAGAGQTITYLPVHEFLRDWLLRTVAPVDVYLEFHHRDLTSVYEDSALVWLAHTLFSCMTKANDASACYYDNVRVHGVDVTRNILFAHAIHEDAPWLTPRAKEAFHLVLARAQRVDDALRPEIAKQICKEWSEYLHQVLFAPTERSNAASFAPPEQREEMRAAVAKAAKNWQAYASSVSPAEAAAAWTALTNVWSSISLLTFRVYLRECEQAIEELGLPPLQLPLTPRDVYERNNDIDNVGKVDQTFEKLAVYFHTVYMDVYALGRMLKPAGGTRSLVSGKFTLFYGGEYHMHVYVRVLQRLGYKVVHRWGEGDIKDGIEEEFAPARPCMPVAELHTALAHSGLYLKPDEIEELAPASAEFTALSEELNAYLMRKQEEEDRKEEDLEEARQKRQKKQ